MNNKGFFTKVGILIIVIIISFIVMVLDIWGLINNYRILGYDKINALVIDVNNDNNYSVSYEIDGKQYNEEIFLSKEYNKSDSVTLYYDGKNPNNLFEGNEDISSYYSSIIVCLIIIIVGVMAIKRYINIFKLLINPNDDTVNFIKDTLLNEEDDNY